MCKAARVSPKSLISQFLQEQDVLLFSTHFCNLSWVTSFLPRPALDKHQHYPYGGKRQIVSGPYVCLPLFCVFGCLGLGSVDTALS